MKKLLLIFVSLFIAVINAQSQTNIYTVIPGDTIELMVSGFGGDIQWQQSDDSLVWTDISGFINSNEDLIATASPTNKRYYRAKITNVAICENSSWYSNIIKIRSLSTIDDVQVGDFFHGGIVFDIDGMGSGFISATNDQSVGEVLWGCGGTSVGASSTDDGQFNTNAILLGCGDRPIAASICDNLILNGYDDWYLPAKEQIEVLLFYKNLIGGFTGSDVYYWSSTEFNASDSWIVAFAEGHVESYPYGKNFGFSVRSVRTFSPTDNYSRISLNFVTSDPVSPTLVSFSGPQLTCYPDGYTFSCQTTGTNLLYQWYKDENTIPGANSEIYEKPYSELTDEGIYKCEISNICKSIITDDALLTVSQIILESVIDYNVCYGEIIQLDIEVSRNHPELSGTLNFNWSPPASGLSNNSIGNPICSILNSTIYNLDLYDDHCGITTNINVNVNKVFQDEEICLVTVDEVSGKNKIIWDKSEYVGTEKTIIYKETSPSVYTNCGEVLFSEPGYFIDFASNPSVNAEKYKIAVVDTCENESEKSFFQKSIKLTASIGIPGTNVSLVWDNFMDESGLFVPDNYYIFSGNTASSMTIIDSVNFGFTNFNVLDGLCFYYKIGVKRNTACENGEQYSFSNVINIKDVIISSHPINQTVCSGNEVTLSVTSANILPQAYQWKKDNIIISGETSNLFIANATTEDEGFYSCVVSNVCTSSESDQAELKVIEITMSAGADIQFCNDTAVQLNATAISNHNDLSGDLSFYWEGSDLSDDHINNPIAHPMMNSDYNCIVTDEFGCETIDIISLESFTPLAFVSNITSDNYDSETNKSINCYGWGNVEFSLEVSGSSPQFNWKYNGGPLIYNYLYSEVINPTSSQLQIISFYDLLAEGVYTCEVTNLCGTIISDTVNLIIIDLTVSIGSDITFCNDTAVQLFADITSNHPEESIYSFQWTPEGTPNIQNPVVQPLDDLGYSCSLTDQNGCSAESFPISVNSVSPISWYSLPSVINVCLGDACEGLSVSSDGSDMSYEWFKDGVSLGSFESDYFISATDYEDEGNYECILSNFCNIVVCGPTLVNAINLTADAGYDIIVCPGIGKVLNSMVESNHPEQSEPYSYSWTPMTGLSSSNVSNPIANPIIPTDYTIQITDQNGCHASDVVNVNIQQTYQDQQLCLVSVDPTIGENKAQWAPNDDPSTESYLILRETSFENYDVMGEVLATEPPEFVDYSSDPQASAYLYKIQVKDTCDNVSDIANCAYHKTIHLTLSYNDGNMGLTWTPYETEDGSYTPPVYYIYRGLTPESMELIYEQTGSLQNYTDVGIYEVYYYMVGVERADCSLNAFSNKKDNEELITEALENGFLPLSIYPNPAHDQITIRLPESETGVCEIIITDITGQQVVGRGATACASAQTEKYNIDISSLTPGVYFIEAKGEKVYRGKVVVE